MTNTSRIAKNTLFLYFRQILIMLVSLYTVREVLDVLGAEDYGIYNVVAGVVVAFGFLSGAMATASQRYFAFDIGKGDIKHLSTTFSVTFQIYLLIAVTVIVLAETAGLWLVNHKLVIPPARMAAAGWIYQAAVASFLLTLMTAPYMAAIIAHENMKVYAYASVAETLLKLGTVFFLKVLPFDKLSLYGTLLAAVALVNTGIYRLYCRRNYEECRGRPVRDRVLFKEMLGYSGWNLFGAGVGVAKNHAVNVLLNLSFGPAVNAARGISAQAGSAVTSFASNFSTAMRPQVIKSYAAHEKDACLTLVYRGCKMTFFLMWALTLPLCLEMDFVFRLWLKKPPEGSALFTRLTLIDSLLECISYQIMTLAQATGKIRLYQGIVGGILLLNLPVSYVALNLGAPAWSVFAAGICVTAIASVARLIIVKYLAGLSMRRFCARVLFPCMGVCIASSALPFFVFRSLGESAFRFLVTSAVSVFAVGLSVLFIGLSKAERQSVLAHIRRRLEAMP